MRRILRYPKSRTRLETHMIVRKTSPFSGKVNKMNLPITLEQVTRWQGGELIQNAMPDLTPDQREFLITGITPKEWKETFGES